jgi:hypothetical protein
MKRLITLALMVILTGLVFMAPGVAAEDYQNFQDITFEDEDGGLLKDFSARDYRRYYRKIKGRSFFGWKIHVVHENEPVTFISETKLYVFNNGFTPIEHNITLKNKEESAWQISATGSIGIEAEGDVKKFKGSIDADIKASVSFSEKKTHSEDYRFEVIIDPLTYVKIITRGEGEVSNGVGKKYFFWIATKQGGWETFTVTTEYYEIVKERIT